jgi:hypothetical protein
MPEEPIHLRHHGIRHGSGCNRQTEKAQCGPGRTKEAAYPINSQMTATPHHALHLALENPQVA